MAKKKAKVKKSTQAGYLVKVQNKTNKLDWNNFNFLENLLIFCTEKTRTVPKESKTKDGVHFHISSKAKNEAICILFHIDRGNKDSLFPKDITAQGNPPKRPDYMVLYAKESTCIITIIEMKGKDRKALEGGIEQIVNLKNKLKDEIKVHLPNNLNFKIQGILLAPYQANIPKKKIADTESSEKIIILPLCISRKAELFDYVSKENKITDTYQDKQLPYDKDEFGFIEKILVEQTLPSRIEDNFYAQIFIPKKDREGIYLNYALSSDEYAILLLNKSEAIIASKQHKKLVQELNNIGISGFTLENIN